MKRLATILPILLALGWHAAGAETLRPQANVDGPVVRLGDLFAGAPEALAGRAVAPAPEPGRSTVFEAAKLVAIAQDARIAWSPLSRFDRAVVTRTARTVTADDIEKAVLAALRAQGLGSDMKVELANRRLTLNAATGPGAPFTLGAVRYDRHDSAVVATIRLATGSGQPQPIELRGSAYRVIQAPVLARNLRHGQVVGHDDIAFAGMRADALDPSVVVDPGAILGKTPRSAVRAGTVLRRSEFVAPVVVGKGQLVIMTLTTPNLSLTVKGRALENGADGQTIRVQNTRSHVTVEGVVAGAGRVVVNLPSLALR
jgi:flagellar basal body P-ring formation protein FlgA